MFFEVRLALKSIKYNIYISKCVIKYVINNIIYVYMSYTWVIFGKLHLELYRITETALIEVQLLHISKEGIIFLRK